MRHRHQHKNGLVFRVFSQQCFLCERTFRHTHCRPCPRCPLSSPSSLCVSLAAVRLHGPALMLRLFYYFISLSVFGVDSRVVVCGRACWCVRPWLVVVCQLLASELDTYYSPQFSLLFIYGCEYNTMAIHRLKRVNFNFVFYSFSPKMNFTVSSFGDHQKYNEFVLLRFRFRPFTFFSKPLHWVWVSERWFCNLLLQSDPIPPPPSLPTQFWILLAADTFTD